MRVSALQGLAGAKALLCLPRATPAAMLSVGKNVSKGAFWSRIRSALHYPSHMGVSAGLPRDVRVSALQGPAGAEALLLRLPRATPAAMLSGGGDGGALGLATRRNRFGRLPTEAASKQASRAPIMGISRAYACEHTLFGFCATNAQLFH